MMEIRFDKTKDEVALLMLYVTSTFFITSGYKIYAILYTQKYRQLYIQHLPFLKFKTNEFLLRIMQTQYNNSI
jgi:hypothetical protein